MSKTLVALAEAVGLTPTIGTVGRSIHDSSSRESNALF